MTTHDDVAGDPRLIVTGGVGAIGNYAVIGHPVDQSRSPELHEAWFEASGIPAIYTRVDIAPDELVQRGPSLRFEYAGLNVTVPHKIAILGYVDRIDRNAKAAGAANLLYRDKDGAWTAGNTDGEGFARSVEEAIGNSLGGCDAVILGAGGAARAIGSALIHRGAASVIFVNRNPERAAEAAAAVRGTSGLALHTEVLDSLPVSVDLLINTLPPEAETTVGALDLEPLPDQTIVADINYYLPDPVLLRRATARGMRCIDGRGMFLWQAALSYRTWMGVSPDRAVGCAVLGLEQ